MLLHERASPALSEHSSGNKAESPAPSALENNASYHQQQLHTPPYADAQHNNNDDDDESLLLAIRLQQEDDDAALRAALGIEGVMAGEAHRDDAGSPSNYAYEDLLRLSEAVGEVSRGAAADKIGSLPVLAIEQVRAHPEYASKLGEQCSICRMEWEPSDELRVLPCGHCDHVDCLDQWLSVNKSCPICMQEVTAEAS